MIEDIKVEQTYGWGVTPEGERIWLMTNYRIMFLRGGEWHEVPVEHINPTPPKEQSDD
jgi:hypothetical protein